MILFLLIGHESCWYKIAWAFLKPIGYNNMLHIDKKIRLQLYKPQKNFQKFERFHTCEVSYVFRNIVKIYFYSFKRYYIYFKFYI